MTAITTGDFLTIVLDGNASSIELTKWVCDKHHDTLYIKNAYGQPILIDKLPVLLNEVEEDDLSVIRAAIGANW